MINFKEVANTTLGEDLILYFEEIKSKIADVRFNPEIDTKTRFAVINVLDEMIIDKLKVNRTEESSEGNDSWN